MTVISIVEAEGVIVIVSDPTAAPAGAVQSRLPEAMSEKSGIPDAEQAIAVAPEIATNWIA